MNFEIEVPCKGCTERRLRCHSECEKYKEFQRKNEERLRKKNERVEESKFFIEMLVRRKEAKRRRNHGKR